MVKAKIEMALSDMEQHYFDVRGSMAQIQRGLYCRSGGYGGERERLRCGKADILIRSANLNHALDGDEELAYMHVEAARNWKARSLRL